jgi:hypothetical protein
MTKGLSTKAFVFDQGMKHKLRGSVLGFACKCIDFVLLFVASR